jgi:hypothetical protein
MGRASPGNGGREIPLFIAAAIKSAAICSKFRAEPTEPSPVPNAAAFARVSSSSAGLLAARWHSTASSSYMKAFQFLLAGHTPDFTPRRGLFIHAALGEISGSPPPMNIVDHLVEPFPIIIHPCG